MVLQTYKVILNHPLFKL